MSSVIQDSLAVSGTVAGLKHTRQKVAYLLSGYPAYSLTFVLNEICGLKQLGFDIVTASINVCDQPVWDRSEAVSREEANTFYVKRAGLARILGAILSALCNNTGGFLRGLYFTAKLGGGFVRFFYFLEALIVGDWMRREGRSHLHTHFGGAVASVAMIATKLFPITLSYTIHGPDEFWDVTKFYLREKIEAASFVCCISLYGRSQLMMLCPAESWSKLLIARLGVDLDSFCPRPALAEFCELEIVCVGRLVAAKGQHVLLSAFRELVLSGRNVRLRYVGKGPDADSLRSTARRYKVADQVTFEGAVSTDRVRELLSQAAVFVLPSFAEGIPIALMEAMAMEIPCVSTTVGGIPELIRNEVDGLLVPPSDEKLLSAALFRLIDDVCLRRRLGRAARLRIEDQYDLRKSVAEFGRLVECQL
jgi:glycosyltransferase involved in cell wall biosynthesis